WIAVEGVERGTNHVVLNVYEVARGRRRRVATASAFGSFGLSWSPDSKFLAFTKPTEVSEDETVLAADLWVAPVSTWMPCSVRARVICPPERQAGSLLRPRRIGPAI